MVSKFLRFSTTLRYPILSLVYKLIARKKIKEFKGLAEGKTVLIVGNGPSLKKTPLEQFDCFSIGMNKINLLFESSNWRPNVIICNNGLVMKQNKNFFESTNISILLGIKAFILGIKSKNIFYFNESPKPEFSSKFQNYSGTAGTVTFTALQFAYYLGAKKIIIVGVDHSFKGYDNKNVPIIEKFKGDDDNHFHPDYFKGQKWGTPNLGLSEVGYSKAYEFLKKNGVEVFDATVDGKLDIFPKISINEALKMIKKQI